MLLLKAHCNLNIAVSYPRQAEKTSESFSKEIPRGKSVFTALYFEYEKLTALES